ncbi:MAG TPA: hypothetical protein VFO84_08225 [Dehalococcoidia bacterium]|nr:hypothetical protein [Dehalococcoidia bacterium]
MNLLRCTLIDRDGGISFVIDGDALPALTAACAEDPQRIDHLLHTAERYYGGITDRVSNGLAIFDERNVAGHYETIHRALATCPPGTEPVFRVVDELTREASLKPAKAGAIVFNLIAKRIVQVMNSYREIKRSGRARVFDGRSLTSTTFSYRLPREWALVP